MLFRSHARAVAVLRREALASSSPEKIRNMLEKLYELGMAGSETAIKAYLAYTRGEVAVMQNRDTSKFVEYRREPKPRMARTQRLEFVNGQFKVSVGIRNRNDYSHPSLDEQLKR